MPLMKRSWLIMGLHVQCFVEKTRMVTVLTTAAGLAGFLQFS